jgi:hypothetical protein
MSSGSSVVVAGCATGLVETVTSDCGGEASDRPAVAYTAAPSASGNASAMSVIRSMRVGLMSSKLLRRVQGSGKKKVRDR